jgi:hypothetical protein
MHTILCLQNVPTQNKHIFFENRVIRQDIVALRVTRYKGLSELHPFISLSRMLILRITSKLQIESQHMHQTGYHTSFPAHTVGNSIRLKKVICVILSRSLSAHL